MRVYKRTWRDKLDNFLATTPWVSWVLLGFGIIFLLWNPNKSGDALFLGASALSAPYFVEWLKKKYFGPKLKIEYIHEPPYCRRSRTSSGYSIYHAQFCVENRGKSQAKSCVAVLEELWLPNSTGKLVKEKNFLPVKLEWAIYHQKEDGRLFKSLLENINQDEKKYCDIGHIRHVQDSSQQSVFYTPPRTGQEFFLNVSPRLHAQPDCILPGTAKIKIGIYADNAPKITKNFKIEWSGKWKDNEEDMLKEIKISIQREKNDEGDEG
jgi:hypothetical protein